MPMVWQEPEVAFKAKTSYGETEIYRTYKSSCEDYPMQFVFTTMSCYDDPECGEDCIFDIRDLPGYGEKPDAEVVADAINCGLMAHPTDL